MSLIDSIKSELSSTSQAQIQGCDHEEYWLPCEHFNLMVGEECLALGIENKANAERLEACWNACKSIPTHQLKAEDGESNDLGAMIDKLRADRDALLRATMQCSLVLAGHTLHKSGLVSALESAKAAMEQAEGKPS